VIGKFRNSGRRGGHAVQREATFDRRQALQLHAHHRTLHARIVRPAFEQLGDHAAEILHARFQHLSDDEIQRCGRFVQLAHHELMNPVVAHGGDALEKDLDEGGQPASGGLAFSGIDNRGRRRPHLINRGLHHRVVESALTVKVVVDGRDVGVRGAADIPHRHTSVSSRRKQARRLRE